MHKLIAIIGGIAAIFVAQSALAQTAPQYAPPPIRETVDSNGVNLVTGAFNASMAGVSIGAGSGALSFSRSWEGNNWRDSFTGTLSVSSSNANQYIASIGGSSDVFTKNGTTFTSVKANGSTLVQSGITYTYTTASGVVATFNGATTDAQYQSGFGLATSITYPTGERLTLVYKTTSVRFGSLGLGGCLSVGRRLQSVTSNSGYMIKLGYASNVTNTANAEFRRLTSVKSINLATDYCDAIADSCASLTQSWPTTTYSYSTSGTNNLITVTDLLGRTVRYATNASNQLIGIKKPSASADNVTISYDSIGRVSSVTRDGVQWTYAYADAGNVRTTTITHVPSGKAQVITGDIALSVVLSSKDELNRTTSYSYDTSGRLLTATAPEGNQTVYTYDARGNITETRVKSKTPGTPADIVTTASYDATCTNGKTCNKPNSTTDTRGKQTDYVYDGTTGLVTKVTAPPPVVGGTRPEVRYSYGAFQAYYKNAAGNIVASGQNITKLTSTSTCVSGSASACVGTATEAKTTIAYGSQAPGTKNNLLPVSTTASNGDGTLSSAESYNYDVFSRLTAVDGPISGTADTVYRRYDAVDRVVGIISPDPDGAGPLKYPATRTSYTTDGQADMVETGTVAGTSDADWTAFAPLQRSKANYDNSGKRTKDELITLLAGTATTQAVTQYSYDNRDRLLCSVRRLNPAVFASLPADACTLGTEGSAGPDRISKTVYDPILPRVSVIEALGVAEAERTAQTLDYGSNGQLLSFTDAKGNKTAYTYDGFIRPKTTVYPSKSTPGQLEGTDYVETFYLSNGDVEKQRLRALRHAQGERVRSSTCNMMTLAA